MKSYPRLRQFLNNYPHLKKLIISTIFCFRDIIWTLRKVLRISVKYRAGSHHLQLHPDGQIPEVLWKRDFEATERDFVSAYLKPGMCVVNIGANVGLYTVMSSALVGREGCVHAFEPSVTSYARLLKNIALNTCTNVIPNNCALYNVIGTLSLHVDPLHPTYDAHCFVQEVSPLDNPTATSVMISATTLDDYLAKHNYTSVDLLIIDVEGSELAVLQGALSTLQKYHPTLMLECSKQQLSVESLLTDLGYKFWGWSRASKGLEPVSFQDAAIVGDVIVRKESWSSHQ